MRRGPKISVGLELAIPFALRRGHVMVFLATLLNLAEFLITGNGLFVLVRVRLARRIRAGIAEIESGFSDAIAGLRLVPRSGPVSCELWLYSKHGILRYFRVEDSRLVEIDSCGTPLDRLTLAAGPAPVPNPSGMQSGHGPAGTLDMLPAGIDPDNPIIRWLKKRNAARSGGKPAGADESRELRAILESVRPNGPVKQDSAKSSRKRPANRTGKVADPEEKRPEPGTTVAGAGEKPADLTIVKVTEPVPVCNRLKCGGENCVPAETGRDTLPVQEKPGKVI